MVFILKNYDERIRAARHRAGRIHTCASSSVTFGYFSVESLQARPENNQRLTLELRQEAVSRARGSRERCQNGKSCAPGPSCP